ncbi:MAG: hypothetical protein Q4F52_11575 [Bacteroidaceae bacterium]|nr:hypothetical protein [Bacteroidaceae bacterium]
MDKIGQEAQVKRTIRDSVFTSLFSDKKYLLQLYRVLHPEDTKTTENDLSMVTIQNVLTDNLYNDLGFMVDDRLMVLVEAQSTWSVNIVMRGLIYLVQTIQSYLKQSRQDIYQSKPLYLPKCELYVLYTGRQKPEKDTLSFREVYYAGAESAIDVHVRILQTGNDKNIVTQYCQFTDIYAEQFVKYKRSLKTIKETIRICIEQDILADYLHHHEKEVITMLECLFDQETVFNNFLSTKMYEAENRGREQGREEASTFSIQKTISRLNKLGISKEKIIGIISEDYGLSKEESCSRVNACLQ